MGHSLCSFILRQIPRRSPTHNAVYFTTTRLGGYNFGFRISFKIVISSVAIIKIKEMFMM